ncbi:MAG: YraN family protein, partial [Armatimonadetes bacterium]|nr:YraN family protein [Armatimonadota bacterium]
MPTARSTLGTQGEILAAKHLESLGYEIIERNYRSQFGEIDIVASQNGDLVFVEVKTRRNAKFGYPSESVNLKKQQKIIRTAQH